MRRSATALFGDTTDLVVTTLHANNDQFFKLAVFTCLDMFILVKLHQFVLADIVEFLMVPTCIRGS